MNTLVAIWVFCISGGVKQGSITAQGVHKCFYHSIRHSGSGIDMIERFQDLGTQSGGWHLEGCTLAMKKFVYPCLRRSYNSSNMRTMSKGVTTTVMGAISFQSA